MVRDSCLHAWSRTPSIPSILAAGVVYRARTVKPSHMSPPRGQSLPAATHSEAVSYSCNAALAVGISFLVGCNPKLVCPATLMLFSVGTVPASGGYDALASRWLAKTWINPDSIASQCRLLAKACHSAVVEKFQRRQSTMSCPGNDSHKRPLHHLLNSQRLIHCYDCSHRRQPSKPWIYAANKLQQIVGPDTTIGLTPTLDSTLRQKPANI